MSLDVTKKKKTLAPNSCPGPQTPVTLARAGCGTEVCAPRAGLDARACTHARPRVAGPVPKHLTSTAGVPKRPLPWDLPQTGRCAQAHAGCDHGPTFDPGPGRGSPPLELSSGSTWDPSPHPRPSPHPGPHPGPVTLPRTDRQTDGQTPGQPLPPGHSVTAPGPLPAAPAARRGPIF